MQTKWDVERILESHTWASNQTTELNSKSHLHVLPRIRTAPGETQWSFNYLVRLGESTEQHWESSLLTLPNYKNETGSWINSNTETWSLGKEQVPHISPPSTSASTLKLRKNSRRMSSRIHARGQRTESHRRCEVSLHFINSSSLTTAAISAPVLWFKAASTIEAIKKKKVLSPVLTKS